MALAKVLLSAGKWMISWNRTSCATSTAFPHCTGELADYAEYIVRLFVATNIHFHARGWQNVDPVYRVGGGSARGLNFFL